MASPNKPNDDSNLATATATSEAATTTINTTKLASGSTINGDGMNNSSENVQQYADEKMTKNGDVYSGGNVSDGGIGEKSDSSALTSPEITPTTTISSNNSPQSAASIPRSKPKPLKLSDNTHQQHHYGHTPQHQLLYHPPTAAAPAAFAKLGGTHMLASFPQPLYVGGVHLPHHSANTLAHQTAMQQHGQQHQNSNHPAGDGNATASIDEILETMEHINRSMKSGQLSTTLAGHIFRLYNYLKQFGELLEQSHKNEMNRVFTSLRQAACRDSGQLGGAPCRLKILELVELRAMGWRPNLAHSQYYMNGGGGSLVNGFNGVSATAKEFNPISAADAMSGGDMEQLGAVPVSAPPFGTFPMNPFAFNLPPTSLPPNAAPVASAAELVSSAATMSPPQAASYYLIPASHVGHTQAGIAFISPTAGATVLPPPPISPLGTNAAAAHQQQLLAAHQQQRLHMPVSASLSQPMLTTVNNNPPSTSPTLQASMGANSTAFPKGMVTKTSGKFSRPAKIPGKSQYRDEVIIRNADSGKIMGVKGRRVAIIEELSKTIISFQKVPQGAKERTLTITGPTEESIEQAKVLIEETIRRNVSPVRGEGDGDIGDVYRRSSLIATYLEEEDDGQSIGDHPDDTSEEAEEGKEHNENANGDRGEFTLEAGQLGEMLKLQCSDPALLEAAKQALSAYFSGQKPQGHSALRRTTTDAASRDQARKERRKSMPTLENQRALALKQSFPPKLQFDQCQEAEEVQSPTEGAQESTSGTEGVKSKKPLTLTMMISPPIGKQKASSAARSTPNLATTGLNKRALCMMKSTDTHGISGLNEDGDTVETKYLADQSGGGSVVVHEKKNRVTVRVVYTREFVLQCAASPFAGLTPAGLPWMSDEMPEIVRPVPGKFDISEYKQMCLELKQLH